MSLEVNVAHERLDILFTVEQEQVTVLVKRDLLVHFVWKLLKLPNAQQRHLDIHIRRKLMAKPSRTSGCRPQADHVFLLENDDVVHPSFHEVIGNA